MMNDQVVQALKNMDNSLQRLRSLDNLLERVATAVEATRASQERVEQMMNKAWGAYDQLQDEQKP